MSAPRSLPVRRFWHGFTAFGINPAPCVVGGRRSPGREPFICHALCDCATDRYFLSVFRSASDGAPVCHCSCNIRESREPAGPPEHLEGVLVFHDNSSRSKSSSRHFEKSRPCDRALSF